MNKLILCEQSKNRPQRKAKINALQEIRAGDVEARFIVSERDASRFEMPARPAASRPAQKPTATTSIAGINNADREIERSTTAANSNSNFSLCPGMKMLRIPCSKPPTGAYHAQRNGNTENTSRVPFFFQNPAALAINRPAVTSSAAAPHANEHCNETRNETVPSHGPEPQVVLPSASTSAAEPMPRMQKSNVQPGRSGRSLSGSQDIVHVKSPIIRRSAAAIPPNHIATKADLLRENIIIEEESDFEIDESSPPSSPKPKHSVVVVRVAAKPGERASPQKRAKKQNPSARAQLALASHSSNKTSYPSPSTSSRNRSTSRLSNSTTTTSLPPPSPAIVMRAPAARREAANERVRIACPQNVGNSDAVDADAVSAENKQVVEATPRRRISTEDVNAELRGNEAMFNNTVCFQNAFGRQPSPLPVPMPPPMLNEDEDQEMPLEPPVAVVALPFVSTICSNVTISKTASTERTRKISPPRGRKRSLRLKIRPSTTHHSSSSNSFRLLNNSATHEALFAHLYADPGARNDAENDADSALPRFCPDPDLLLPGNPNDTPDRNRYAEINRAFHRTAMFVTYSAAEIESLSALRHRVLRTPDRFRGKTVGGAGGGGLPALPQHMQRSMQEKAVKALWKEVQHESRNQRRTIDNVHCAVITSMNMSSHVYQGAGEGYCLYELGLTDSSLFSSAAAAVNVPEVAVEAVYAPRLPPLPQPPLFTSMKLTYMSNICDGRGANEDKRHCPFELFDVLIFYYVQPSVVVEFPPRDNDADMSVVLHGGDASRCALTSWQWARFSRAQWETARQNTALAAVEESTQESVPTIAAKIRMPRIAPVQTSPKFAQNFIFDQHACKEARLDLVENLHQLFRSALMLKCVPPIRMQIEQPIDEDAAEPQLLLLPQQARSAHDCDGTARSAAQSLCVQAKLFEAGKFREAKNENERYAQTRVMPDDEAQGPRRVEELLDDDDEIPLGADANTAAVAAAAAWVARHHVHAKCDAESNKAVAASSTMARRSLLSETTSFFTPRSNAPAVAAAANAGASSADVFAEDGFLVPRRLPSNSRAAAASHLPLRNRSPLGSTAATVYYDAESHASCSAAAAAAAPANAQAASSDDAGAVEVSENSVAEQNTAVAEVLSSPSVVAVAHRPPIRQHKSSQESSSCSTPITTSQEGRGVKRSLSSDSPQPPQQQQNLDEEAEEEGTAGVDAANDGSSVYYDVEEHKATPRWKKMFKFFKPYRK